MSNRLKAAAEHYGADYEDLRDWYRDDVELVAELPSRELAALVEDYLRLMAWYRQQ